ncbi:hypothetical protein GCM10011316_10330 [Roseibium aquae]|uniref:Uncharacterized protein n=1 Tax=Roseibium aquae TaxID=1323746 RepID=A0A916TCV4_9HYPH|nr:hypothetical protein GCM10011316_10330 [Roseibium aquae]
MAPDRFSILGKDHGGQKFVGLARKLEKLAAGGRHIVRFGPAAPFEGKDLIRSDDQIMRPAGTDILRFRFGEDRCQIFRRKSRLQQWVFDCPLIDLSRVGFKCKTGIREQFSADPAPACKDK